VIPGPESKAMEGARGVFPDGAANLSSCYADSNQDTTKNDIHNLSWPLKGFSVKISSALLPLVLDSAADVRKLVLPRCG
jgi:hypothetical protein